MSAPARTMPMTVDRARKVVTPALQHAVARLCPGIEQVSAYHQGWQDAEGNAVEGGAGKLLRASLALLSARAVNADDRAGIPAAVAVELVHGFSLLHDDIMDGDTERRHRPTAWTVFGTSSAILAGDALLAVAVSELLEQDLPGSAAAARRLMTDTQRLISGEYADIDFERRNDVQLDECIRMSREKTGALLSCASALGAELAGCQKELADGLAAFGEHLGLAFQLVDDLLGIWGSPEQTGKPVLSDLRSRKKSLPVVAALSADVPAADELAKLYATPEPLDENDLVHAAELIEQAGGRAWVERAAAHRTAMAEQVLTGLDLPCDVRLEFLEIARFVTGRDH